MPLRYSDAARSTSFVPFELAAIASPTRQRPNVVCRTKLAVRYTVTEFSLREKSDRVIDARVPAKAMSASGSVSIG